MGRGTLGFPSGFSIPLAGACWGRAGTHPFRGSREMVLFSNTVRARGCRDVAGWASESRPGYSLLVLYPGGGRALPFHQDGPVKASCADLHLSIDICANLRSPHRSR